MKIVLFGGTGDVGQVVVDKLCSRGESVTVLTRQTIPSADALRYVTGNVLNPDAVAACIEPGDQVIITLGFDESAADVRTRGTKNILDAMKAQGCRRVACVSSHGVGDSWEAMPDAFKQTVASDPRLSAAFHDHDLQEQFVRDSGLDWTIVRPTGIVDTPETGAFSIGFAPERPTSVISKRDVAQFLVDALYDDRLVGRTVLITN
jgi:nucleoside-diphosphate-sugar epimerase